MNDKTKDLFLYSFIIFLLWFLTFSVFYVPISFIEIQEYKKEIQELKSKINILENTKQVGNTKEVESKELESKREYSKTIFKDNEIFIKDFFYFKNKQYIEPSFYKYKDRKFYFKSYTGYTFIFSWCEGKDKYYYYSIDCDITALDYKWVESVR